MQKEFVNALTANAEIVIDQLSDNPLVKEIPILSTSLNLIRGVMDMRNRAYLNKVHQFFENLGEQTEAKRMRLIEESKKDEKSRSKFGEALFMTIERSDSQVKILYLAAAFEGFLMKELDSSKLRQICHVINSSFSDDLEYVIESKFPNLEQGHAFTGLAIDMKRYGLKGIGGPNYSLSESAELLRKCWFKYGVDNMKTKIEK